MAFPFWLLSGWIVPDPLVDDVGVRSLAKICGGRIVTLLNVAVLSVPSLWLETAKPTKTDCAMLIVVEPRSV